VKPNHPPISKSRLKRIIAAQASDWELYQLAKEYALSNVAPTSKAPISHGETAPGHLTEDKP